MVTENGVQVIFFYFIFLSSLFILNWIWSRENLEFRLIKLRKIRSSMKIVKRSSHFTSPTILFFSTQSVDLNYRLTTHSMSTQSSWKWIAYKTLTFIPNLFFNARGKNNQNSKAKKILFAAIRSMKMYAVRCTL